MSSSACIVPIDGAPVADFAHGEVIAGRVVFDLSHVVAHQKQAAAAGAFEIFRGEAIGDLAGIKAATFIGDADLAALGVYLVVNENLLGGVHLVAMLDGIDERLFQGKANAEDFAIVVAHLLQLELDLVLNAASVGRVARDDDLAWQALAMTFLVGSVPVYFSHGESSPEEDATGERMQKTGDGF